MIIIVNTKGITIDVSMSEQLTSIFETKKGTIFTHNIKSFAIKTHSEMGESVRILDNDNNEYWANHNIITSINNVSNFTNADDVFTAINNALISI